MSNHFHICKWCDTRYPGDALLVEGVDDNGRYRAECACAVTYQCRECAPELYRPVCVDCDDEGVISLATEKRWDHDLCSDCATNRDEKAHEASLSEFYGGASCQTVKEHAAHVHALDRGMK